MRQLPRLRRITKWTGLGLAGVISCIWILGAFWNLRYLQRTGDCPFSMGYGEVVIFWSDNPSAQTEALPPWVSPGWTPERVLASRTVRWGLERTPVVARTDNGMVFIIPFWIIFAPVAISTVLLFWRDRRRVQPGHCKCGYDLTGNVSRVCPECGEACRAGG